MTNLTDLTENLPVPASMRTLLERAAHASLDDDVALDDFMRAAWLAFTGARPGLRAALEEHAMRTQLDELRAKGRLALA